jgi:hypothetical protein
LRTIHVQFLSWITHILTAIRISPLHITSGRQAIDLADYIGVV